MHVLFECIISPGSYRIPAPGCACVEKGFWECWRFAPSARLQRAFLLVVNGDSVNWCNWSGEGWSFLIPSFTHCSEHPPSGWLHRVWAFRRIPSKEIQSRIYRSSLRVLCDAAWLQGMAGISSRYVRCLFSLVEYQLLTWIQTLCVGVLIELLRKWSDSKAPSQLLRLYEGLHGCRFWTRGLWS